MQKSNCADAPSPPPEGFSIKTVKAHAFTVDQYLAVPTEQQDSWSDARIYQLPAKIASREIKLDQLKDLLLWNPNNRQWQPFHHNDLLNYHIWSFGVKEAPR